MSDRTPSTFTFATRSSGGRSSPPSEIPLDFAFVQRYAVGPLLGQGGMGMVVEASERASGQRLAIKFLKRPEDQEALARFQLEGRLLTRIHHPSVIKVLETGTMSGHPYLVCEFLSGGTLRDRMVSQKRLSPTEAVAVMTPVLAGLHACHEHGVIHRDLKPENVLFDAHGTPKLADLGIAKSYAGSAGDVVTQHGALLGTPAYMSPEQARGDPVGVASDVYSAGILLYELLAGEPPFRNDSFVIVLNAHLVVEAPPLCQRAPEVPEALAAVVHAALAKKIGDRPASAEQLALRIRRAVARPEPARSVPVEGGARASGESGEAGSAGEVGAVGEVASAPAGARRAGLAIRVALLVLLAIAVRPARPPQQPASPTKEGSPPLTEASGVQGEPLAEYRAPARPPRASPGGTPDAVVAIANGTPAAEAPARPSPSAASSSSASPISADPVTQRDVAPAAAATPADGILETVIGEASPGRPSPGESPSGQPLPGPGQPPEVPDRIIFAPPAPSLPVPAVAPPILPLASARGSTAGSPSPRVAVVDLLLVDDPEQLHAMTLSLIADKKYEQADTYLEKAMGVRPGHVELLFTRGRLSRLQADLKGAVVAFEAALRLDPCHRGALDAIIAVQAERKDDHSVAGWQIMRDKCR